MDASLQPIATGAEAIARAVKGEPRASEVVAQRDQSHVRLAERIVLSADLRLPRHDHYLLYLFHYFAQIMKGDTPIFIQAIQRAHRRLVALEMGDQRQPLGSRGRDLFHGSQGAHVR